MKRCTVLLTAVMALVLVTASTADAGFGRFRGRLFRSRRVRVAATVKPAARPDAAVTDGQQSGTPGTITPRPAGNDDVIDVDKPNSTAPTDPAPKAKTPRAVRPVQPAAEEESAVPMP